MIEPSSRCIAEACKSGVGLTALRQATNQAANFTAYTELKRLLYEYQPQYNGTELPSWQTAIIGLISGACGPCTNTPIDTIKTRIQRATALPGETAWSRVTTVASTMFREEGLSAFYSTSFVPGGFAELLTEVCCRGSHAAGRSCCAWSSGRLRSL